jgi:hypothetical protein
MEKVKGLTYNNMPKTSEYNVKILN